MKKLKLIGLITIIIIVIIAIILAIVIYFVKGKNEIIQKNISFEEAFSLTNFEKTDFPLENSTNEVIMKRYTIDHRKEDEVKKEVRILKSNVIFEGIEGKMIYSRMGELSANIFQYKTDVNSFNDFLDKMDEFDAICKKYLGFPNDKKTDNKFIFNTDKIKENDTVEKNVYEKGLQYCYIYKKDKAEYNVNFYIVDGKLILEFVKIV